MAGTTYSFFFWQDYQTDNELKVCSMGAQGLWMRLLCIAASGEPRGHVLVGGAPPTPTEIRRITGCSEDEVQIEAWIRELVAKHVCDRMEDGHIVSRRIVRDEKRRAAASKAGKVSARVRGNGNPANARIGTKKANRSNGSAERGLVTPSPESRVQSPESVTGTEPVEQEEGLEKALSKAEQLCRAIGVSLTEDERRRNWPMLINRLIDDGVSFDALLATAKRMHADGLLPEDGVRTPNFFRVGAESLMRKGARARVVGIVPASAPKLTFDEWKVAFEALIMVGAWVRSECGPAPFEPGCVAPPGMVEIARKVWEANGNHPKSILIGNSYVDWEPRLAKHSLIPSPIPFIAKAA